jgi:hypothetical protein
MGKNKKNVFKSGVDTYAINLLWINREEKADQKYIHKADTEEKLIDELFRPAVKWAKSNPEADINIWYDSKGNSEQAISSTQSVLDKTLATSSLTNVKLRDLREIEFVKANEFLFDDGMHVYYRIDLLKLITSLHTLQSEAKDAVVFSDLDLGRKSDEMMNKSSLFDSDTITKLEKYGIVFGKSSFSGLAENQFIQVVNDKTAIEAIRIVINSSSSVGLTLANECFFAQHGQETFVALEYSMGRLYNVPFKQTVNWIPGLYNYMNFKTASDCKFKIKANFLGLSNKDEFIDYNPDTHGDTPLGNMLHPAQSSLGYALDANTKSITPAISFTDNCLNVIENTRPLTIGWGNCHDDMTYHGPKIGNEPFKLNFWEKELVEVETNSYSSEL